MFDVIFPQQNKRDLEIKTGLCPVTSLDESKLLGYTAEATVKEARGIKEYMVMEFDDPSDLDEVIESLTSLRKLWLDKLTQVAKGK